MRKHLIPLAALIAATPLLGQDKPVPSPPEIVNAAPKADWAAIAPSDLMVMDLAPDTKGKPRRVVIQLMPAPFSQGWVSNIRKLAAARFWDGTSINRVQDNYVVQWGDATEKKPLPEDLAVVPEADYTLGRSSVDIHMSDGSSIADRVPYFSAIGSGTERPRSRIEGYPYSTGFLGGWPFAGDVQATAQTEDATYWPVHCYGMVGVGRDMPPNTGTGAELYTVIGHAPRHLDRNIALVGRVIEGIEHLSSL
ncbi:MAG: peptidylprolyl isomerase, partial [Novosphingobium sp.]